jgi:acyl dehydratase
MSSEERRAGDGKLYLDDLQVGQRFTSGPHAMDESGIKAFARQYDPQPYHLDEAAAQKSLFGGLVASGWHTAAVTMRLLVESVPIAGGVLGAGGELSWPRPTRPGDVLMVVSEIVEVKPSRSRPDRGMAMMRSETRNQRDEPVQIMTSRLVVPRRPA